MKGILSQYFQNGMINKGKACAAKHAAAASETGLTVSQVKVGIKVIELTLIFKTYNSM